MSYIDGVGGLTIVNGVIIAHGVTIMTTEHRYSDNKVPIREQGFKYEKIDIGSIMRIGSKITILARSNSFITGYYDTIKIILK